MLCNFLFALVRHLKYAILDEILLKLPTKCRLSLLHFKFFLFTDILMYGLYLIQFSGIVAFDSVIQWLICADDRLPFAFFCFGLVESDQATSLVFEHRL